MKLRPVATFVLTVTLLIVWNCTDYRSPNEEAVERLQQRLKSDKYDEIYGGASAITRAQLSREDFVARFESVTRVLKGIDSELNWRRDERGSPEEAVYRDDNWSSLVLEKDGKRADIQLDWSANSQLCGMLISGDVPDGAIRVFRNCD